MALRIVDEGNFPTLGGMAFKDQYPGDYSGDAVGLPAARDYATEAIFANSPMMRPPGNRYEDIVPFTGNNFIGNIFNPSGSDAKLAYAQRAQKHNSQIDDQARRDALTELNIMKSIEATPPGKRDPQLKILQKFYQQRGKPFDPEIQKFYKTADENQFKAAKWAAGEIKKQNPTLSDNELWQAMNEDPALQVEWFGEMGKYEEQAGKAEGQTIKNKRAKLMYERLQQMEQSMPVEGSTSPQEPLQQAPVQAPSPAPQQAPGSAQGPSRPSQRGVAFNQMVDTIGDRLGATPHVKQMVKASLAMETSDYDLTVISPKGAQGIGQFMPPTARQYGVQDPNNPGQAITGMVKYYTDLEKMFPGKPELQFASYNAGQGAVQQAGNKVPNYPETQGYVQKGMQYLGGQAPQERRAHIPAEQQNELTALERSISQDMKRAEILSMASGDPEIDKEHDNLMKRIEVKQKKAELLEKKHGLKFDTNTFEGWLGAKYKTSPSLIPATVLPQLQEQYEEETGQRKAGQKRREALATQDLDLERARAGNMGNIPGPDTILKYRNTTGKGPLRPSNLTNSERAAENNEAVEAGGQEKWVIERPLEAKTEDELNLKLSAVDSTKRVMEYLDDPKIAGFVGTLLSNPTAGFTKAVADVWGGTVPEKYRETAAEIANLTSTILNDRIGSAQTATEFKRLGPLIKDMSAVDSGTLKASMRIIHNAMAIDFNRRYRGLVGRGYEVLPDWKEVKPLETTMDREKREAAETQTPDKTPSATRLNPFQEAARKARERKEGKP